MAGAYTIGKNSTVHRPPSGTFTGSLTDLLNGQNRQAAQGSPGTSVSAGGSLAQRLAQQFGPATPRTVSYQTNSGGGGIAGGLNVGGILEKLQAQMQQSNQAGLSRYNQVLQESQRTQRQVNSLYGQANNLLTNVGQGARRRIETGRQQGQAQATQGLIGAGLGNTTITQAASRGVNADAAAQHADVDEQTARLRSGLLVQQAGQRESLGNLGIDSLLSREDYGPDMSMYLKLLQQLAAAGGGTVGGLIG